MGEGRQTCHGGASVRCTPLPQCTARPAASHSHAAHLSFPLFAYQASMDSLNQVPASQRADDFSGTIRYRE